MPYERIYSEKLDSRKSWYAYNSSIPGYQRRNWQHSHEQNILFKSFASEIQQVNIGDIQDSHGRPVLSVLFATRKVELVYAISSFGILALALRQRNVNQDVFSSEAFQQIISAVNARTRYRSKNLAPILFNNFIMPGVPLYHQSKPRRERHYQQLIYLNLPKSRHLKRNGE